MSTKKRSSTLTRRRNKTQRQREEKIDWRWVANAKDVISQLREEKIFLQDTIDKLEEELSMLRANDPQLNESGLGSMPENPNKQIFSTGAVRRKTEPCRLDLIPLEALEALGDRLHFGATVRGYGERNWEKGIDYANLIQHTQTHLSRLAAQIITNPDSGIIYDREQTCKYGHQQDTPYGNACAALWNLMAIVTFLRRGNPAEEKP